MNDYIKTVSLDEMSASELDQYNVRIRTLLMCTEETIPGSRSFGLSRDFLDLPQPEALNQLAVELQEKADVYLPEINIDSVDGEYGIDGKLTVTINIVRRAQNSD